jgi:methanogenic corrinoid protein MtbC1
MRRLISAGVAPAEAAQQAIAHRGKIEIEKIIENCTNCSEMIETLYRATNSLDRDLVTEIIRREITEHGIIAAWQDLIVPVLVMVGADWQRTGTGVEVEHMLTEILKRIMREEITHIEKPINARPVLLASVGEELHSLALHALAAALAERSIETYFLGARTPLEALSGMVTRSAPPAIFLWAQMPQNGDPKYFRDIPVVRPAPRIILGGPGWDREKCHDAAFADGLAMACEEIARAVGS